jgi:hypothetical protein
MTYSKTRATQENPAKYVHTPDPLQTTIAVVEELSVTESKAPNIVQETLRDRFAAPEYVNPNARLPRIQALRLLHH